VRGASHHKRNRYREQPIEGVPHGSGARSEVRTAETVVRVRSRHDVLAP